MAGRIDASGCNVGHVQLRVAKANLAALNFVALASRLCVSALPACACACFRTLWQPAVAVSSGNGAAAREGTGIVLSNAGAEVGDFSTSIRK